LIHFYKRNMEGLTRFEEAVLKNVYSLSENDEFCDLEVQCCDGSVSVQGLVLAAICPNLIKTSCAAGFDSQCIVFPDIYCHEFLIFLRTLLNPALLASIKDNLSTLQKVTSTLGLDVLLFLPASRPASMAPDDTEPEEISIDIGDDDPATDADVQHTILADTSSAQDFKGTRFIDNLIVDPSGKYSDLDNLCILLENNPAAAVDRKCLLNLGKVEIDVIGDEVLTQNFCDQEGRLVCLVCYKIMGPSEFQAYREHLKGHDLRQLEKISIIMPNIGRGGPGLKKKFLSDSEIDEKYLDTSEDKLKCDKCTKKFLQDDKTTFRKHLHYHSGKEKNYVYLCTECSKEFNDPSNLKRHIQSVHEKQLFRCLHCDFEDRRKQKLEDHLLSVHKDKVWVYDEVSLNKGQEVLSELTEPLPPMNTGQHVQVADNPYIYKCSACSFKKRRLEETEDHIKLFHDSSASIKKIALKQKDQSKKQHQCEHCNQVFLKLSVLNQHKFRVHNIALGSEFTCQISIYSVLTNQDSERMRELTWIKSIRAVCAISPFLC